MFHFPSCSDSSLIRKASSLQIGVERFGVYEEEKDCLFVVAQLAENTHEGICLSAQFINVCATFLEVRNNVH